MTLQKYRDKRDFSKTPEPHGKAAMPGEHLSFHIQKHHARRLHYDFRLELGGTLKSWAIPKGPSLDPADKRLAVHVEDHPLEYGTFEGDIPEHQYGAGHVIVWDTGVWVPDVDPEEGYRKGNLKFHLYGEKLSGGWALVRMGRQEEGKDNWLLVKERDEEARSGPEADIVTLMPDSVLGKSKAANPGTNSFAMPSAKPARKAAAKSSAKSTAGAPAKAAGKSPLPKDLQAELNVAPKAALPTALAPQLATLADEAPSGDNWLSEIKFDGYRALCRIDNGEAALFTRAGNDWTDKWPMLANAAARLPLKQAWLDGEVVALDDEGRISFQLLQNMAREGRKARLAYYLFDLPYLDGRDLRGLPLAKRKELLQALLSGTPANGPLLYSDHLVGNADEAWQHACMHGMEGIVIKLADSIYASTRSRGWLKLKCQQRQEFVVGGYTDPAGSREQFGALLLGVYDEAGKLQYAGRVGTGFDDATLRAMGGAFRKLASKASPFATQPPRSGAPRLHWLKPELVAEVKFAEWTAAGVIRHATFVGLRSDKSARDITHEAAVHVKGKGDALDALDNPFTNADTDSTRTSRGDREAQVAGVRISNPSRILFADTDITKLMLARYYEEVAHWMLPHLAGRPLMLVRCPQGAAHDCFFQKHANETTPANIERIDVNDAGGSATYLTASTLQSLIGTVQMGVLELHTWGSSAPHLDQPDRIIFDLDPAPELDWRRVVEAAQLMRGFMQELGLESFVKTTGGKGLHVVVPIKPERTWDEIKPFSRSIAEHFEETLPAWFTAKMTKARRHGRIYIDYLRNGWEATAVAAFSTRARPGAPVSVPIAWDELSNDFRDNSFTLETVGQRLKRLARDPWHDYFTCRQRVTAKMLRALGLAATQEPAR